MNPTKRTYAEILKAPFPVLNPKLVAEPLLPKPVRARLTKEAKANLRSIIKNEPTTQLKQQPVMYVDSHSKPQQLTLVTASDWVMSGSELSKSIRDVKKEEKTSPSVRLMHPNELGSVIREGKLENPIEVCDDSDECLSEAEEYSVDGMGDIEKGSDFDLDVVIANSAEIFGPVPKRTCYF